MRVVRLLFGLSVLLIGSLVIAETQPYATHQHGPLKALTQQQISDYLEGKGMGLAKPAELSGYPGPKHVLELAEQLQLQEQQLQDTQRLYEHMLRDAQRLGEQIVALETQLDYLFTTATVNDTEMSDTVHKIGKLKAQLRLVHLAAHLKQKAILNPHQIHTYSRLRGYDSPHH